MKDRLVKIINDSSFQLKDCNVIVNRSRTVVRMDKASLDLYNFFEGCVVSNDDSSGRFTSV